MNTATLSSSQQQSQASHSDLQEKVIDYLQDVHALEQNVKRMLDSMISTTTDQEILARLRRHKGETERQEQMIRERLHALGRKPSMMSETPALLGAWLKGVTDKLRPDKPGRNARDAFVTEHLEIASYKLLEKLAERAGDHETAQLARQLCQQEEEMARWIDSQWDKVIDLNIQEFQHRQQQPGVGSRLAQYWQSTGSQSQGYGRRLSQRGDQGESMSLSSWAWIGGAALAGLAIFSLIGSSSSSKSSSRSGRFGACGM